MAKCNAKNARGERCKMHPIRGGEYCFIHAPDRAAERAQARRRGGRNSNAPHYADASALPEDVRTLEDARKVLTYTLAEVAGMENSIARARVLLALFDSFVKSIEIGELEARIAALEASRK